MNAAHANRRRLIYLLALVGLAVAACGGGGAASGPDSTTTAAATAASPSTTPEKAAVETPAAGTTGLNRKLIVGYQGWFGCPGDFEGNEAWQHWFPGVVGNRTMTFDALPAVQGLDPKDLCDTGLPRLGGGTIQLFSSQRPGVVMTHFRWMKEQGIDGAAVQRFVVELADPTKRRRVDNVLANVRSAAETNGRVFYLTYDVSGASAASVVASIRSDWARVVSELKVTESSAYLRDGGKPVIQLWGFGFTNHPGESAEVAALITDLKNGAAGLPAATVVGGVPSQWRSLNGDSKTDPAWAAVYRSYDVLSPWSVGRFADNAGADAYAKTVVEPDLAEATRLGVRYLPVVFPGFSWHNLMTYLNRPESAVLNAIPRQCGNFMWRQVRNLLTARASMMYVAMFDEVDEATALIPIEAHASGLPVGAQMIYLNQDGCSLPEDWYLRVTAQAAKFVQTGAVPPASLGELLAP